MYYITKPVVIEAVQWTGTNLEEIKSFVDNDSLNYETYGTDTVTGLPKIAMSIDTLEGTMTASVDDYIIKGLRGEFYPCKPDVFKKKYDLLAESGDSYV